MSRETKQRDYDKAVKDWIELNKSNEANLSKLDELTQALADSRTVARQAQEAEAEAEAKENLRNVVEQNEELQLDSAAVIQGRNDAANKMNEAVKSMNEAAAQKTQIAELYENLVAEKKEIIETANGLKYELAASHAELEKNRELLQNEKAKFREEARAAEDNKADAVRKAREDEYDRYRGKLERIEAELSQALRGNSKLIGQNEAIKSKYEELKGRVDQLESEPENSSVES